MSNVIAAPDMLAAATADVAGVGWSLSDANAAATASTTKVIAAGSDEVSAAIASLFSGHAKAFQAISAQAAAFHSQFVQALHAGAGAGHKRQQRPRRRLGHLQPGPRFWASPARQRQHRRRARY